jgi:3-oxoacyl-[acyl-carrier protein] reductase
VRFHERVAIVTGAARGIGAATARRLASEGARVVVADIDAEAGREAAARIEADGGWAFPVAADVSSAGNVRALFDAVFARAGRVDILVNNAGISRPAPTELLPAEAWDEVLAIDLRSAFLCSQAALPAMKRARYGKIVNVSSIAAHGSKTPGNSHYAAAKAGLIGLTKTLALECGPYNVCVNAVAPGIIDTEMNERTAARLGISYGAFRAERAAGIALGRLGTQEEVAAVIAFLASDDASFVNGEVVHVAGGPIGVV